MAKVTMYRVKGRKFARAGGKQIFGVKSEFLADVVTPEVSVVQAKLDEVAMDAAARAEVRLRSVADTGHSYIDLSVSPTGIDRYVSLVDPPVDGGQGGAAMAIEGSTGVLSEAFGLAPIRPPRFGENFDVNTEENFE